MFARRGNLGGFMGQVAYIDLEQQTYKLSSPKFDLYRKYLGGRGIAIRYLWENVPPKVEPYDPRNVIVVSTGPYTGTLWPCGCRYIIAAKSPQTYGLGYAGSGGFFGSRMKYAGFDALIIRGQSEKPVWIDLNDGKIEFHDASSLWGLHAGKTEARARKILKNPEARGLAIGPAGENLVRFACVINDHTRAAGRTGMGAVMGSKNLKIITAHGTYGVQASDPTSFSEEAMEKSRFLADHPLLERSRLYGSAGIILPKQMHGDLPTKNMQFAQFADWEQFSGEYIRKHYWRRDRACYACPIGCAKITTVTKGSYKGQIDEGVEYESIDALGPMLMISDWGVIKQANLRCNKYGLDTISTGVTIAFAMELWEKQIINETITGGMKFIWGDSQGVLSAIDAIAYRQGFGDVLAEGAKIAGEIIGGKASKYAMQVKGVELPRQEPRSLKEFALTHATSNRGADHMYGLPTISAGKRYDLAEELFEPGIIEEMMDSRNWKGKAEVVTWSEPYNAICDSLGICNRANSERNILLPKDYVSSFTSLTGFSMSLEELLEAGERIVNLERVFNIREFGLDRSHDILPYRFLNEPLVIPEIDVHGSVVELDLMLDRYYELHGWSMNGRPTKSTLRRLGLDFVFDYLQDQLD